MKPGMYFDISNEEYHNGTGISKSGLDKIAISPLHYWGAYLSPDRPERVEKKHFRIGTAIHTRLLEPDTFDDRYMVIPPHAPRRPTKAQFNAKKPSDETLIAIEWWNDWELQVQVNGALVVTEEEKAMTIAIADNVGKSRLAEKLFAPGSHAEASVYWTDEETGVLCKCRPDWLLPDADAILDVKSTRDASPDGFTKSVWNYRYHVQAAWYLDGVYEATALHPDAFMFLAVEPTWPYAVAWYFADSEMIEAGRREYRRCLRQYADCLAADKWPGYADRLQPLSLPAWAVRHEA